MLVYVEHILSMAGIRLYDEDGQGLIEYVLIAALISIAVIGGMALVGGSITSAFETVGDKLAPAA